MEKPTYIVPNGGLLALHSSPPTNHCEENVTAHLWRAPLSPVIYNSTNGRQPVDSEGLVGLPNDHGGDGNGGGLSAFTPLLINKVQIAVHSGHLVRGEAVSAVIICGDKKENTSNRGFDLQTTTAGINPVFLAVPST